MPRHPGAVPPPPGRSGPEVVHSLQLPYGPRITAVGLAAAAILFGNSLKTQSSGLASATGQTLGPPRPFSFAPSELPQGSQDKRRTARLRGEAIPLPAGLIVATGGMPPDQPPPGDSPYTSMVIIYMPPEEPLAAA